MKKSILCLFVLSVLLVVHAQETSATFETTPTTETTPKPTEATETEAATNTSFLPIGAVQAAPSSYADIPNNHWAAQAVTRMTSLGILTGYPDGSFQGQANITRYETSVIAARLVDYVDQLYVFTNDDVITLQNRLEAQDTQLATLTTQLEQQAQTQEAQETRLEQIVQEQVQEQVQTQLQEQARLQQADAINTVHGTLKPDESTAVIERLDRLDATVDRALSTDYMRQLEDKITRLQEEVQLLRTQNDTLTSQNTTQRADSSGNNANNNRIPSSDDTLTNGDSTDRYTNTDEANSANNVASSDFDFGLAPERLHPIHVGVTPVGVNSYGGFTFAVRGGYDIQGPISVVGKLAYTTGSNNARFTVAGVFPIKTPVDELELYAGLGLGITAVQSDITGVLEFPFGAEYFINPTLSLVVEIAPDYNFALNKTNIGTLLGVNFHF